jgi:hypothetical protein
VVHACSSTTYPYSHYNIYKDSVYPFYQQNPCKLRFAVGPYVRYVCRLLHDHSPCFRPLSGIPTQNSFTDALVSRAHFVQHVQQWWRPAGQPIHPCLILS